MTQRTRILVGNRTPDLQAPRRRRMNPFVPGQKRSKAAFYYDRIDTAVATAFGSEQVFFITPMSATKTKLYTNLQQSGQLSSGYDFDVQTLQISLNPSIAEADLHALLENYYYEWSINNTTWLEGPLWTLPAGGGVAGVSTESSESSYSHGLPSPAHVMMFEDPIRISSGETFKLTVRGSSFTTAAAAAGGAGVKLTVLMRGVEHGIIS